MTSRTLFFLSLLAMTVAFLAELSPNILTKTHESQKCSLYSKIYRSFTLFESVNGVCDHPVVVVRFYDSVPEMYTSSPAHHRRENQEAGKEGTGR